ncbi:unnamed protein product [Microthlaspi erraticum]|uniref:Uncharacterized protein n=1 Tax=Microthlaspi erraticum TaxID=1685480 RepID=A0A6D2JCM3_9BRAS|nr:unnamed protein product [Microthlaspi erraticum]
MVFILALIIMVAILYTIPTQNILREKIKELQPLQKKFTDVKAQLELKTYDLSLSLKSAEQNENHKILGTGMSSKMWEITLDHARSCVLDNSVHVYQPQKKTAVVFNVIAQVLGLLVEFQYVPAEKLSEIEKATILLSDLAQAEAMVIAALSHPNEVISYDDESSMMRNFLNVPSSQTSVGIDYSGMSLTSWMVMHGFVGNLHNAAESSGK